jgi:hypothetical protein
MGRLFPLATKGKPFFEGSSDFRAHDDASDQKSSGSYSHNELEAAATEFDEIVSTIMFMIELAKSGAFAWRIRNESGGTLTKKTQLYVSGFKQVDEQGDTAAQVSAWALTGVEAYEKLYWKLTNASTTRTIELYADAAFTDLVSTGSRTGDGSITLADVDGSGVAGTVTVAYTADDTDAANILVLNQFLVAKADATDPAKPPMMALDADLANNSNGTGYGFRDVTGIDTSGAGASGAAVYLDPATPGAITFTLPTAAGQLAWEIGRVEIKDATTGSVRFFPAARKLINIVPSNVAPKLAAITVEAEGTPGANDRRFTIQVQDANGNSLAQVCMLDVWIGTADLGAPVATTSLTISTGTIIQTVLANGHFRILTDANGTAKVVANPGAGVFTKYLMAVLAGSTKSLVTTWA